MDVGGWKGVERRDVHYTHRVVGIETHSEVPQSREQLWLNHPGRGREKPV